MKRIINLLILITILFLGQAVFASSEILGVLEHPAVSRAKKGDLLEYRLGLTLPKDFKTRYNSFSATVKIDKNLEVKDYKLNGATLKKGAVEIKKTVLNTKENLLSLNVNDMSKINKDRLELIYKVRANSDITMRSGIKNSLVISYINKNGNVNSDQKNIEQKGTDLYIRLNPVKSDANVITGETLSGAKVWMKFADGKFSSEIAKDDKFSLKVLRPLKEGEVLKVYADLDKVRVSEELKVAPQDKIKLIESDKPAQSETQKDDVKNINFDSSSEQKILADYLEFAKKLNTKNLSKEDFARLRAKIANAEYMAVKSDLIQSELDSSLKELKLAIEKARPALMNGTSKDKFSPNSPLTRAQTAAVLRRSMNLKPVSDFSNFKDVDNSKWYASDIAALEDKNIISGYAGGNFKPEKDITRAEFAVIVSRYLGDQKVSEAAGFKDVKSTHWAYDAINSLYEKGILKGRDKTHFAPDKKIKRSEAAKVLNILNDRTVDKEFLEKYSKNPFKDVDKKNWAYYEILEVSGN